MSGCVCGCVSDCTCDRDMPSAWVARVLPFLTLRDVAALATTCHAHHQLLQRPEIWAAAFSLPLRHFQDVACGPSRTMPLHIRHWITASLIGYLPLPHLCEAAAASACPDVKGPREVFRSHLDANRVIHWRLPSPTLPPRISKSLSFLLQFHVRHINTVSVPESAIDLRSETTAASPRDDQTSSTSSDLSSNARSSTSEPRDTTHPGMFSVLRSEMGTQTDVPLTGGEVNFMFMDGSEVSLPINRDWLPVEVFTRGPRWTAERLKGLVKTQERSSPPAVGHPDEYIWRRMILWTFLHRFYFTEPRLLVSWAGDTAMSLAESKELLWPQAAWSICEEQRDPPIYICYGAWVRDN